MARIRSLALLADDILAPNAIEMTDNAIEAAVNDPAPVAMAVEDDAAQLELDNEQLAVADGDAEVLDQTAEVLEEATDNGEVISPVAAECIRILASHIASKHGVTSGGVNIARESFKSKSGALQAQRIALESLESIAKNIWKQIVKAYERVIEFFKKWWNKFFDGATKMRDRAIELEKTVNSKSSKISAAPDTNKVILGDWFEHIAAEDGTINTNALTTNVDKLSGEYSTTTTQLATWAGKVMDAVSDALSSDNAEGNLSGFLKNADGSAVKGLDFGAGDGKKVGKNKFGEDPENTEVYEFKMGVGRKSIYVRTFTAGLSAADGAADASKANKTSGDTMSETVGSLKVWMDDVDGSSMVKDVEKNLSEVDGKNPVTLKTICNGVKNLGIDMIKNKNDASKLEAQAKKIKDRAAKLAGYVHDDDDRQSDMRAVGSAARACVGLASSAQAQVRSHFLTTGNALLSFVQACISASGAKDKKDMTKTENPKA